MGQVVQDSHLAEESNSSRMPSPTPMNRLGLELLSDDMAKSMMLDTDVDRVGSIGRVEDALLDLKALAAQDAPCSGCIDCCRGDCRPLRQTALSAIAIKSSWLLTYFEVMNANRLLPGIRLSRARIAGQQSAAAVYCVRVLGGGWVREVGGLPFLFTKRGRGRGRRRKRAVAPHRIVH